MASFTGHSLSIVGHDYGATRAAFLADPIPFNAGDGWLASQGNAGIYASTQPVAENPRSLVGHGGFSTGYGALFYNRIHMTPSLVDFGNLLTDSARYVELWNGFLASKPLESLASAGADGVSLDSPVAVPSTLLPLQAVVYTLTVITDGPAEINALFTWQVDGQDLLLIVVGSRVVVFPFLPNWEDGLEEELAWKTSIERAYAGDEQRAQLRNSARKRLQYPVLLRSAHDSARLENLLFGWQARNFAVPIATERSRLTAHAPALSTTLYFDTTDLGFYDGQQIVLISSSESYEAAEIDTVNVDHVTLRHELGSSWAAGTPVYPVGVAHLQNQQEIARHSNYYSGATFDWLFQPTEANANTPSTGTISTTYRDIEVYLLKPDWVSPPTFSFDNQFVTLGADDIGALAFDQKADFPMIIRQHRYVHKTRAQIAAFRQFLARRRGRLSACWVPSWNSDFIITAPVDSSASVITVKDNGYRAFVDAHDARRDIAIFLKSQTVPVMCRINSTVDNFNGTINLVLSAVVGQSFDPADIRQVCHLNLFRFGSDALTLQWPTRNVVLAMLSWLLVKE